jgi:hypothetical protein
MAGPVFKNTAAVFSRTCRPLSLINFAVKRLQGRVPLCLGAWLAGAEVNAQGAKVGSAAGLKLSFQQSAGNSTGPELNVLFGALRNFLLH